MPTPDAVLLANLATQAARLLPETCTIRYPSVTVAGGGHGTAGWTVRATGVPCRLAVDKTPPVRPDAANRLMVRQPWLISLPVGQAVLLRDQIVIGSRTFDVLDILNGSWEIARQVRCAEST